MTKQKSYFDRVISKINVDKFIRKTFHLKKEKPSGYKLGKKGFIQTRTPSTIEREIIEAFS